jgi:hypothetical protein
MVLDKVEVNVPVDNHIFDMPTTTTSTETPKPESVTVEKKGKKKGK